MSRLNEVWITGAGGYIGGRLVQFLHGAGVPVRALVREPTPRLEAPATVCDLSAVAIDTLSSMFAGADSVVHLAGENEVLAAREPATALAGTVAATERVAQACAIAGVRRLVYLSTVNVYGERMAPGATLSEDLRPEPRTAYAIARLACEHVVAMNARSSYQAVVLRLSNSVGAPDDPAVDRWTLVANDLCRQGALGGRLQLQSSGAQWRDFVHLGEVCEAIAVAARPGDHAPAPGTYNLAGGHPVRVRALAEMIQEAFARETGARPELIAPEMTDRPAPYYVSVQRAAAQGLRLTGRLEDAVSETVRFCLRHREEL